MTHPIYSSKRHYAILGTGAIGGYYGACLRRSGQDVHFLLHSDYEHVQQHGLKIDSVDGDFTLPNVQAYQRVEEMPTVDVVIIALKTTQNAELLPHLLPPLLKPDTGILMLQNGLGIESDVANIAPDHPILGGLCFICSNKVGPGHIHHLDYGGVTLGAYDPEGRPGGQPALLTAIAKDFEKAGVVVDVTDDLYLNRWRKLAWNIPYNSLSVVLNATTTEMMADANARQLIADLMAEVVAAAHACTQKLSPERDRTLPDNLIDSMLSHTAEMKPYRTSMKIDFDEGRPLEIDAIVANPLESARWAGIETPRIEMLYHQLKALDRRNTQGSSHGNGKG